MKLRKTRISFEKKGKLLRNPGKKNFNCQNGVEDSSINFY